MADNLAYKLGILNDSNFEYMQRSLEKRIHQQEQVTKINLLPVVVEAHRKSFGVEGKSQISVLQSTLFQNLHLKQYEGLYLFSNNNILQQSIAILQGYERKLLYCAFKQTTINNKYFLINWAIDEYILECLKSKLICIWSVGYLDAAKIFIQILYQRSRQARRPIKLQKLSTMIQLMKKQTGFQRELKISIEIKQAEIIIQCLSKGMITQS
ncbi:hypothetical protein pb186bvf_010611 [Paramecium bursaria]